MLIYLNKHIKENSDRKEWILYATYRHIVAPIINNENNYFKHHFNTIHYKQQVVALIIQVMNSRNLNTHKRFCCWNFMSCLILVVYINLWNFVYLNKFFEIQLISDLLMWELSFEIYSFKFEYICIYRFHILLITYALCT